MPDTTEVKKTHKQGSGAQLRQKQKRVVQKEQLKTQRHETAEQTAQKQHAIAEKSRKKHIAKNKPQARVQPCKQEESEKDSPDLVLLLTENIPENTSLKALRCFVLILRKAGVSTSVRKLKKKLSLK